MKKEIIEIEYPTSVIQPDREKYIVGNSCKTIKQITKNGEMASIDFYEVELNDGTFVEIRASEVIARFKKIKEETDNIPF